MQDIIWNILYDDKMTKEEKIIAITAYKTEFNVKLEEAIQTLEKAIAKGEGSGKAAIDGYMFDARFAVSLRDLLLKVRENDSSDIYEKAEDFINLQLITASKQFRDLAGMLYDMQLIQDNTKE